ncbi:ArsR/SmtB family transcription factor [Stackebrandtia soli]|uniref:ArsR/SmtB family transcription factor n=1 Tax=Stackebrandtia soli TaxID=1892856 RepID=UPI0039E7AC90
MTTSEHSIDVHGVRETVDTERLDTAVSILGLLADRTRLALLHRLSLGDADVTTLCTACDAARPSVSQHLAKLRLAKLVTTRRDGRHVIYSIRDGHLRRLIDEALSVADHHIRDLPSHD